LQIIDNGIIHRRGSLKKDIPEIHAYHLLPKGVGKETGLKRDLKLRGYSKDQAIAIGDALSDLDLANEVGALFLVSNAFSKHSNQLYDSVKLANNVYIAPLAMNLGFAQVAFEVLKSVSS
jgi:hydroxymethylpyrimidine pyrophosphatase-like HAD family hydrolase